MRPYYVLASELSEVLAVEVLMGRIAPEDLSLSPMAGSVTSGRKKIKERIVKSNAIHLCEFFAFKVKELSVLDVRSLPQWIKDIIYRDKERKKSLLRFCERDIVLLDFLQATGLSVSDVSNIFGEDGICWTESSGGRIRKGKTIVRLPKNIASAIQSGYFLYYIGWKKIGDKSKGSGGKRIAMEDVFSFDKIIAFKSSSSNKIFYFGAYK